MSVRRSVLLSSLVLAAALPAAARADVPVAASAHGTAIVADDGYAAWRADDGHLVVRAGNGGARETNLVPPSSAVFDVGALRGAGARIAWAERCSTRSRTCVVRGARLGASATLSTTVLAHIPYRGGGSPALAIDSSTLAYAVREGRCDVPYVRTTASSSRPRKLDRGHCAKIAQLDVNGGDLAVLARDDARHSEARVLRTSGGPSRTLQAESQGEESNFIGAVALDGRSLYTARGGIRQANVFTRFRLDRRERTDVRAFVSLQGAFSRDGGRDYYAQATGYESTTECGCLIVAGSDPFAGAGATRTLSPSLALTVAPQPVFVDTAASAVATLTRQTVSRTAVVATAPVAGVPVELYAYTATDLRASPLPAPQPTGLTATTGADGTASIPVPGPAAPFRFLAAATRPAAGGVPIPTAQSVYLQTYAHVTATTTRLADGHLRVTGTISPALPGRKVRLDRKERRICNNVATTPGSVRQPSQAGVPAGCFDAYTQDPVTTAPVSAGGASYTIDVNAPAGTYVVSLDFAGGANVFPGQSAPVDAG
jgi:hypothetical protein